MCCSGPLELTVADMLRTPPGVAIEYCQIHSFTWASDWAAFVPVFDARQLVLIGQYVMQDDALNSVLCVACYV